jgi:hypothetical protein
MKKEKVKNQLFKNLMLMMMMMMIQIIKMKSILKLMKIVLKNIQEKRDSARIQVRVKLINYLFLIYSFDVNFQDVDTSFLPDRQREEEENLLR